MKVYLILKRNVTDNPSVQIVLFGTNAEEMKLQFLALQEHNLDPTVRFYFKTIELGDDK